MEIKKTKNNPEIELDNQDWTMPPENNAVVQFAKDFAQLEYEMESQEYPFDPQNIERILKLKTGEEAMEILKKGGHRYYDLINKLLEHLDERKNGFLWSLGEKQYCDLLKAPGNKKLELIENTLSATENLREKYPDQDLRQLQQFDRWCLRFLAGHKDADKSIDIAVQYLAEFHGQLKFEHRMDQWELGIIFKKNPEVSSNKLFSTLEKGLESKENIAITILLLTDLIGVEETRSKLNDALHQERTKKENTRQSVIDNLEYAGSFITPNHEKIAVESLPDLYEHKIKFETYGLNGQMQGKEVALLEGLIKKDQKVLEAGMGTGRLFLELQKSGYDITGFDFTQRHVALVRGEAPDAKVFKGDWKNNALQNESFDAVYSLGRNILHEYSLPDQVQMFRKTARVLKKGGKFIFDIPNRDKGEYKERVEDYAEMMEKKFQVRNYRRGAIYDSPNGVDFATRYAYSNADIENLAQLAGLRIAEVRREPLPTGKGDDNLYYVLEKI